jgi:hypothetical protein
MRLGAAHLGVESRLVAFVGNEVEHFLDRARDDDPALDLCHLLLRLLALG